MTRIRPWQPYPPVTCERCDDVATHRIYEITFTPKPDDATLIMLGDAPGSGRLACAAHQDDVAMEIYDSSGGCGIEPLRATWGYWITEEFLLTRWIGRLAVVVHNWRFDRAFGLK